jgi:hypothetical protein
MSLVPPLLSQATLMIKDPVIPHIVKTALNLTSALLQDKHTLLCRDRSYIRLHVSNQLGELYDSGSCYWIVILELHEHVCHLLVLEVQIDDLPH